ncbi:tyrosine-type recombinase/integrase [Chitinophaga lutea]
MDAFKDLAERFLAYLALRKRYSPHTTENYRLDLWQFFQYLEAQYPDTQQPREVNSYQIQSWLVTGLASRQSDGAAAVTTVRRKISSLRSYFKFAIREGELEQTPMNKVTVPKLRPRLPLFVEEKGMQLVEQNQTEEGPIFGDDFDGLTRRLALDILYQTGIRRAELIGLQEGGVDRGNSQIKVLGKGGKERIIPISGALMDRIQAYLARKAQETPPQEHRHLLVRETGAKLSDMYVYRTVRAALDRVTTIQKRSPHILRHTFATHLVNNGADINAVKELMGHASLASTQVYTHNTIEKLKKVHQQAHPKA